MELDEIQAEALLNMLEATDRKNEAMGVTGQEVAAYNLRVLKLRMAEAHLLDANVELRRLQREHEAHPVTVKIEAWRTEHKAG